MMSEPMTEAAAEHVDEGADPPGGPVSLGVEVLPTGNPEVDALIDRLGNADDLLTEDHVEVYEDVHRGLREALTALDDRS
jgi:hypothetical protein